MGEKTYEPSAFLFKRTPANRKNFFRETVLGGLEKIFGLNLCEELYSQIDPAAELDDFARIALEKIDVDYQVWPEELKRIPETGPCVLVANHPYGGIEGLVLFHLLSQIRPDFKVMGNFLLGRIPQLQPHLIEVDPFGGEEASRANFKPLRQALQHLQHNGMLVIFPAGEVSSWKSLQTGVVDPAWNANIGRLIKNTGAPVVPIYFPGHNGLVFQLAGLLNRRLRTLLLPRMLLQSSTRTLKPVIGHVIPGKKWCAFKDARQVIDYLRFRTYALGLEKHGDSVAGNSMREEPAPAVLAPPVAAELLEKEISDLPAEQFLLKSSELEVYYADAGQIPKTLQEIGRLRELTFREVGEGTGKATDIDRFDGHYLHLFIWNREKQELIGAYRIGQVDRILATYGAGGIYTTTLFHFNPELLNRLNHGLELGRSFIRPEYQRSFAPLLLLWKGIGHFIASQPGYRYLFGPVSISRDYCERSREIMTSALTRHYRIAELSSLVKARLPVAVKPLRVAGLNKDDCENILRDIEEVSALVADFEADSKGIPVLLRHYLGLGGKLLAFNLDPAFSDVIDGLLLVDLPATAEKQLQRYMGAEGCRQYREFHAAEASVCSSAA